MGWFDRYDDSYRDRGWGNNRDYARSGWDGGWGARNRAYGGTAGWGTTGAYDRGYGTTAGYDRTYGTTGGYGYGTRAGYGSDYRYPRRRPEESPTYGEGGDQAVQHWAQRYGYDVEYEIQPRGTGGQGGFGTSGGYGGTRGGYGGTTRGFGAGGGYGGTGGYGGGGGYGGTTGGYGRGGAYGGGQGNTYGRGTGSFGRRTGYDRGW